MDASNPERYLLGVSAAITLYRKAGQIPSINKTPPPPACEPDELPRCNPAAAIRLATILSSQYGNILPEWLMLAEKNGKRVPEELLPELLEWGTDNPDHLELILPVIGRRGNWLASLNPVWAVINTASLAVSAQDDQLEEVWQTGERKSRRVLLRLLRGKSASSGRNLIASTWGVESAEDRAAFLATFATNLSMEDEPFLEAALNDRSKEVRQTAARLLACLPQSRLVERMIRRVQPLLRLEAGRWPLRRARIEVIFPETCDTELSRNGVEAKPPSGQTIGEKAWWLRQMMQMVPPQVWNQWWHKSAGELLEIAADGEWRELLHEGWYIATLLHRDADWAIAMLKIYPQRTLLLEAVEPGKREPFIHALIQSQPKDGMALAIGYRHPWSQALTRLVLSNLRRYYLTDQGIPFYSQLRQVFLEIGQHMHPESLPDAERILKGKEDDNSAWKQAVQSLLSLLEFRHQMIEELTS
ncbi:MAG: DUF5691 domain-containing protein [Chloroflexota bacterium]